MGHCVRWAALIAVFGDECGSGPVCAPALGVLHSCVWYRPHTVQFHQMPGSVPWDILLLVVVYSLRPFISVIAQHVLNP